MMTNENQSFLSMECPLCGHQKIHKHGKPVKEVNGITAQIAGKISPKLLILFTIADKCNQKKFGWCYKLILKEVA